MSDIHLEFDRHPDDFLGALHNTGEYEEDILVLAGDITYKNRVRWINLIALRFKYVIYILGNHEYYTQNLDNTVAKTREALSDNVYLLNNETITIEGVNFHGTTLWTDFDNGNPITYIQARHGLNDFRKIRVNHGLERFTPQKAHTEHNVAKQFLLDNVKEGDIVITHHAPSFQSCDPKFKQDSLNGAYMSNLDDFVLSLKPSHWIHGHIHHTSDYMIGDTRVLCNPRGYVDVDLNDLFDDSKYIEI